MASKYWVLGTGNLDGVDTTHISDSSGGAGGAVYPSASDTLIFDGSSGGGTVTFTAGATFAGITSGAHTGTIDTNGQTVTLSGTFAINGTGTRTVTLGASAISCAAWTAATTINLTFNAGTSTITSSGTFAGGGLTYSTLILTGATATTTGANTFTTLTRTGTAVKTSSMSFDGNQTVSGTFTVNGNSATNRTIVTSNTKGTPRTITAATVSASNVDFQDIVLSPSVDLSAITGGSGDAGGNSGITFTTPQTNYWVSGTGSQSDVTHWANSSGGSGSTGRVPLIQDTARIDANSGTGTITQDMPRIGATDFTGSSGITWTTSTAASFFGSINLTGLATLTGSTQTYTYEGRGSSTLTSAGNSWANGFTINCVGGSLAFGDAFTSSNQNLILTSGTLDSAGYSITVGAFSASSSSTRTLSMGASTWTLNASGGSVWAVTPLTGLTLNAGTSTIRFAGALTATCNFYVPTGTTWYRFENATTNAQTVDFYGSNTFTNGIYVDASAAARTVRFTAGTTTTLGGLGISRDAGSNMLTIESITAAAHTLSKATGRVSLHDTTVTNSTATQTNTFYAGATPPSVDGGGNTNWLFQAAPGGGGAGNLTLLGVG